MCASRKLDKHTESPFSHWIPNNARFWFPNARGTRRSHYMTTWDLHSQWQSRQPRRKGILIVICQPGSVGRERCEEGEVAGMCAAGHCGRKGVMSKLELQKCACCPRLWLNTSHREKEYSSRKPSNEWIHRLKTHQNSQRSWGLFEL